MSDGRGAGGIADAESRTRHVFLRDMRLDARVGIYAHEQAAQPIRVNVDLAVDEVGGEEDAIHRVVDYERVANAVRRLVAEGHVKLVETLAERIAYACLADPRVRLARIRVEKLDVFPDAASAGVEVERRRG